ncbi:phage head completion protein [Raoultibacter timonensis]|uniref:phage head completion protein n=1 Tax=Raoultibacter timonensis TaxID=1907662 RepID=UPI0026DDB781|nr:head-tail adaptor protein [Raoultibacter timonensis]
MGMPSGYRPPVRLDTVATLLVPVRTEKNGVRFSEYPDSGVPFACEFKSYGGTESSENGILSVIDTASVKCWFDPRITAGCRIALDGSRVYDVVGEPEDVGNRHQYMQFKVERCKGGA